MYCPDCGLLNRPGAKYCTSCQSPLGVTTAAYRGPLPPDQLMDNGRYRIIRALGKGGMGAVYLAENLQAFGREVVIKEMLDYFDPNSPEEVERARRRFEEEARTLATLKHPAVPDIYGYFSQAGRNYLVMEFIIGENLEAGVTHRDGDGNLVPALPYTQEQIIHFGVQLCDLLEYLGGRRDPRSGAHRPVIHHDIKPANILRNPASDRVWLVDFGTAKTRFDPQSAAGPSADQESVYGTVGYAPPEQYQGQSVPRTDVFALAATLYHLLTDDDPRDHPFQFDSLNNIPIRLRLALRNALAEEPTERSTAAEFKTALTSCLPDRPAVETKPLAFPDGKEANALSDIPKLAQEHWDYTRDILYAGDLELWLRRSMHNPVAAETAKRVTTNQLNKDAGLDTFLRELDPRFPSGKLQLGQRTLDLGTVTVGGAAAASVNLNNRGVGYSHGEVTSSASWLHEKDGHFGLGPGGVGTLDIEVDTDQLTPGERYREALLVKPADGSKPLQLEVTLTVAEPRIHFSPEKLTFDLSEEEATPVQLTLNNTGGGKVDCTLTRDERWLLIRPRQLALPAGQSAQVTVMVRADRLPPMPTLRTHINLNPSHGPAAAIPVTVTTRRRRLSKLPIVLLGVAILLIAGWLLTRLVSSGTLAEIPLLSGLVATPTPMPTAEELDRQMVQLDGFKIDRYEVTRLQYARYDPSRSVDDENGLLPVVDVAWEDARLYCEWAGKRLPTLEQWRLAAQGPEGWLYPWGNEPDPSRLNSDNNRETNALTIIGSYPTGATPSGIHDLLGNASEWVIGDEPGEWRQIQVGGSWVHFGLTNTRTFRESIQSAPGTIGFRCILSD